MSQKILNSSKIKIMSLFLLPKLLMLEFSKNESIPMAKKIRSRSRKEFAFAIFLNVGTVRSTHIRFPGIFFN